MGSAFGVLGVFGVVLVAFILFSIYFIFKQLEFVLVSVNLYRKMVRRQDETLRLLLDIRDGTKTYERPRARNQVGAMDEGLPERPSQPSEAADADGSSPYLCSDCDGPVWPGDLNCRKCGASVEDFADSTELPPHSSAQLVGEAQPEFDFCFHCGETLPKKGPQACPKCGKAT